MTDDLTGPTGGPTGDSARQGAPSPSARAGGRGRDRELMEAVAADLRAMRGRQDSTHELVHQHAGLLSEALPQLESLGEQVAVLTGRVNALAGANSHDQDEPDTGPYADELLTACGLLPDPGHQVDWHLMSAAQAAPAWEALAAWVAAVVCGRLEFTRAQLPDCWALHPRAVAELSWAHQLHRTYAGAGIGAHQVADWHTRWLPQLQARLTAAIPLLPEDPLAPDTQAPASDTAPRCRLGHFHHLSSRARRTAELGLDQNLTQPDRPGGQRDRSRLTAATIPTGTFYDDTALEAARGAIHDRRHRAQQSLDTLLPRHGPAPDPARARYLPVFNVDAHPHADPAAEQPAHPSLWLPLYREAAHHDLTARRHREQHPDQRPDVTLGFSPAADHELGKGASSS